MEENEVEKVLALGKTVSRRAKKQARRETRREWRTKYFREIIVLSVVTVVLLCVTVSLGALVWGSHIAHSTKFALSGILLGVIIGIEFVTFGLCFWGE